MKKITMLVLCSLLLVGCGSITQDLPNLSQDIDLMSDYIFNEPTDFNGESVRLKNEIIKAVVQINPNWEQGVEIEQSQAFEIPYNMFTIWDINSKVGWAVVNKLEDFIGIEFMYFINDMRGKSKEEANVEHRIINNYGVTCNNQYGKVSIRVIQLNKELMKEENVLECKESLLSDKFLIGNVYKGEKHQLIEAITPELIRNGHISREERTNGARYQIFKTNSGELEKLRVIIYDYGKEDRDSSYEEVWNKIAEAAEMEEPAERKTFIEKIDKVIKHKEDKQKGKTSKSNYKITRYAATQYFDEELIEILVEMDGQ